MGPKGGRRQAKIWQKHADRPLRVAVNLSPSQFRLGTLLDTVRSALTAAELEPRFLEVELTETAVMRNAEESIYILESLSRLGILVSVDDFGTGYSSMSYLRRFPIDKLKIDRTFVKEMTTRPEDASIVRAMVSLAHSLNLKVVAEGVETAPSSPTAIPPAPRRQRADRAAQTSAPAIREVAGHQEAARRQQADGKTFVAAGTEVIGEQPRGGQRGLLVGRFLRLQRCQVGVPMARRAFRVAVAATAPGFGSTIVRSSG